MELKNDKALVGADLARPLAHFKAGTTLPTDPNEQTRFKKKEKLDSQPKSILKHRIQTLTGQNMVELESKLGFNLLRDGVSMGVQDMRRLAHLLIREANGDLEDIHVAPVTPVAPVPTKKTSRRSLASPAPTKVSRGRRSLAPETLRDTSQETVGACRYKKGKSEPIVEEEEEEEKEEEDPNLGLDNPTPQMLALRRKSLAKKGVLTPAKKKASPMEPEPAVTPSGGVKRKAGRPAKSTPAAKVKKVVVEELSIPEEEPKNGFTGKSYTDVKGATVQSEVFFAQGSPAEVSFKKLKRAVPEFKGCNLAVVHTPADWEPPEVFNVVQSIRLLNKEAGLSHFLVLVGCGVSNVHMFREALARQTQHVQFVVFERDDQNVEVGPTQRGKLRETTSYFLLAYFFPGAEKEGSKLPMMMVREGMTTCFRTTSVEDLENTILHALSEPGDWLLDLAPRRRELTLAAQKSGRFAVAVDEDADALAEVAGKARAIAEVMDERGFGKEDGVIARI